MKQDLTTGNITSSLLRFAFPMMIGNLLQQCYNIADTLIVGQFLGKEALAAVGSAYSLMTFLTSILIGLCMGSGVKFSICYGGRDSDGLKSAVFHAFLLIAAITAALNIAVFIGLDPIMYFLNVPQEVYPMMRDYLWVIFFGIAAVCLYNFFTALLRAVGNSLTPLIFLAVSSVLNVILDLLFVVTFPFGIQGAAFATVLSQFVSGIGLMIYALIRFPDLRVGRKHMKPDRRVLKEIAGFSVLTCLQQSVMNFGILLVQGLVNSFGPVIMAAFAAAVKIDSFAYMPVQDFGNAFSTFIAQNYGAKKEDRIRKGTKRAVLLTVAFSAAVSVIVFVFARPLMLIFVRPEETEIIAAGVSYLRIEGSFYILIGILFLWYGFYRAIRRPSMSLILTIISLGTRVALAYALSAVPQIGVTGIWASVPIGWFLADAVGSYLLQNPEKTACLPLIPPMSLRFRLFLHLLFIRIFRNFGKICFPPVGRIFPPARFYDTDIPDRRNIWRLTGTFSHRRRTSYKSPSLPSHCRYRWNPADTERHTVRTACISFHPPSALLSGCRWDFRFCHGVYNTVPADNVPAHGRIREPAPGPAQEPSRSPARIRKRRVLSTEIPPHAFPASLPARDPPHRDVLRRERARKHVLLQMPLPQQYKIRFLP